MLMSQQDSKCCNAVWPMHELVLLLKYVVAYKQRMRCMSRKLDADEGFSLGDHSASNDAIGNKLSRLSDVHLVEFGGNVVLVTQHARHICHQNELLCLQSSSNLQAASVCQLLMLVLSQNSTQDGVSW